MARCHRCDENYYNEFKDDLPLSTQIVYLAKTNNRPFGHVDPNHVDFRSTDTYFCQQRSNNFVPQQVQLPFSAKHVLDRPLFSMHEHGQQYPRDLQFIHGLISRAPRN